MLVIFYSKVVVKKLMALRGTDDCKCISSDSPYKEGNTRLTTVNLKPLFVCVKLPKRFGLCMYTVQSQLNTAQRPPTF